MLDFVMSLHYKVMSKHTGYSMTFTTLINDLRAKCQLTTELRRYSVQTFPCLGLK